MDIYTKTILRFASNIPNAERLKSPDVSITKRTAVCGSSMTVDLNIKNGKIEDIGLDIKACALGQASASILAKNILGSNCKEIQTLRHSIFFMLTGDGSAPKNKFSDYEILSPAKDYKNRHASILLALDAVVEAIDQIRSKISVK